MVRGTQMKPEQRVPISLSGIWSTAYNALGRRRGTYDRALSVFGTIRELTLNRIFER